MSDEYKYKDVDVFAENTLEPYYYGPNAFDNFYKINNENVKIQQYSSKNTWTKPIALPGYKINNSNIRGCQYGTVPKISTKPAEFDAGSYLTVYLMNDYVYVDLKNSNTVPQRVFSKKGIKCIGFIACAGGGGAGGYGWYDPDKDGSWKGIELCPGSGGGGGGIICGVLDLTNTSESRYFIFDLGGGGKPGNNNPKKGSHSDGLTTYDGEDGEATNLYWGYAETSDSSSSPSFHKSLLATAYGGKGGIGGVKDVKQIKAGGDGGTTKVRDNINNFNVYIINTVSGEKGCCANDSECDTKEKINTYSFEITNTAYCKKDIKIEGLQHEYDVNTSKATFPGGSSYNRAMMPTDPEPSIINNNDFPGSGGTACVDTTDENYGVRCGKGGHLWLYY